MHGVPLVTASALLRLLPSILKTPGRRSHCSLSLVCVERVLPFETPARILQALAPFVKLSSVYIIPGIPWNMGIGIIVTSVMSTRVQNVDCKATHSS